MTSLNELLGHRPDDTLVVVSCDDLGSCHAVNSGTYRALREGWATSAGLMVPGPWAREAAARYRGEDVGVHLTVNAEHELFRWGPLTQAPSLLSGEGGFPRTREDVWDHADLDELRRECRAQVERAIYWGFDVTHLSSHLNALVLRPEFFDVVLDLAIDFQLPLRLPNPDIEALAGFQFRKLATEEGIISPDRVVTVDANLAPHEVAALITGAGPGLIELVLQPATDTPELRAMDPHWNAAVQHLQMLEPQHHYLAAVERADVTFVGYRQLRSVQRRLAVATHTLATG